MTMLQSKTNVSKSKTFLIKDKYDRILKLFFEEPSASFHVNKIIRRTKKSSKIIVKALKELESLEILNSRKIANSLQYKLQNQNLVVKELKRFYFIDNHKFAKLLNKLFEIPEIKHILLYGSFVKGEYTENSDLDLCLVGVNIPKIDEERYTKILGRKIHFVIMSIAKFEKLKQTDLAFYIELRGGVSFGRCL